MEMKGIAASPGIVIGKALILKKEKSDVKIETISEDRINDEIDKLHNAIEQAKKEIK
ncbi:phosphoenolpyruvate-utilizing N-terminal domain-containing protein, partial [Petrotoga halophila]|uniref:phosphoenolpyruvate-utilizing N-terminal domain-containing protein n=1 Tax=Petrotoga halophila TaxID=301141 RepID=UPI001474760A